MITLNTIIKRFEDFANNHFFIRSFSFGSPEDVDLQKFDSYPLMHVVYTGATYEDTTKTLDFEIYIFDLPSHYESKTERQKEIVSDAEQCAEDILADIANGGNIFIFDEDYEVVNATVTPLQEAGSNVLAGVLLELGIQLPYDRSACNAPIDGVQPEGGGFVYARRGLLRMLTQDGTVDVLSVNTIKVANGTLIDEGGGVVSLETGGGGGSLEDLDDVTITDPLDHDSLIYDEVSAEWINGAPKALDMAVFNGSGSVIAKGKLLKAIGSHGDKVSVGLFDIATDSPMFLVGFATTEISIAGTGHVRTYGELRGLSTDSYAIGTVLYPSTTPGDVTDVPSAPVIPVAIVTRSQQNTGRIYIRTWTPGDRETLNDLDDVVVTFRQDREALVYDSATSNWINGGAGAADILVVNNSTTTDINAGQVVRRNFGGVGNSVSLYNSFLYDGSEVLGVAITRINRNGGTGYVRTYGIIRNINTSGLTAGGIVYGGTTAGSITTTLPTGGYKRTVIGFVLTVNSTTGSIFVRCMNIPSVASLSDYDGAPPSYGQVLAYSGSTWGPRTITTSDVAGGGASPPPGGFKSVWFQDAAGALTYETDFTYDTTINTLAVDNITTTGTVNGRNMVTDGSKLDGIAAGAEVNVNADWNAVSGDAQILNKPTIPNTFGTIAVSGQSNVVADSTTDTLTLVAGTNVTITTDASTDSITIAASGGGGSSYSAVRTQSGTTYTLVLGDAGDYIQTTSTTAVTITVPPQSSVAWAADTEIYFEQNNTGQITIAAGSGVTINSSETLKSFARYSVIALKRVAENVWTLTGERALI
jgi:hypothetical protein